MPRIRYTATFPDGTTITRSSERVYTHAWRIQYEWPNSKYDPKLGSVDIEGVHTNIDTGFAGSFELAHKAGPRELPTAGRFGKLKTEQAEKWRKKCARAQATLVIDVVPVEVQ